ncbi:MAG: carboxypeptidase-like regulatory domain-containing protein, partial [Bacteroidales bacterium]
MKKFSFLFAAMFLHVYSFCQFTISGKVIDENNQPLSLANVLIENTFNGTYSNVHGDFVLKNIKKGTYKLKVSFIGYEKYHQTIQVNPYISNLTIVLKKAAYIADEITVQATRSDKSMSGSQTSISKESIKQNNLIKDVPFLLSITPSVVTTSDAGMGVGYTGISIRGSDVRRINVTINDIPLNDAESHGVWWVDIPDILASTDNIQIQRGVGSSTNGAGAFGATINMQTLTLNKEPFAEFNASYGSYNTSRLMLNTSTGLINNHFNVDLRLSKIYSDGYVDRAFSDLKSYYLSAGYYSKSTMIKFINFSGHEKTYQAWNGNYKARYENDYAGMDTLYSHGMVSTSEYNTMIHSNSNTCNIYSYPNQTDNYWQSHYQLHITHEFSEKWNNHTALHYTKGKGYYESFRENKKYSDFGLKPVIIGNDTIEYTDFIDQKWLNNDFYGIVSSFNYHYKSLSAKIGLGANRYDGKHYGDLIWAKVAPDTMS